MRTDELLISAESGDRSGPERPDLRPSTDDRRGGNRHPDRRLRARSPWTTSVTCC